LGRIKRWLRYCLDNSLMKATGLVAVVLAVVLAGVWVQSERHPSDGAQEPLPSTTQAAGSQSSARQSGLVQGTQQVASDDPAQQAQVQQKLAANERSLADAQDRLQRVQDDIQSSDLDLRIQRQQQIVTDLQARAQTMNTQNGSDLQNQAILAEQSGQVLQQKLSGLQQQIQTQQGVSNGIVQQMRNTVAPDGSDIVVALNQQLEASERQTQQLQAEYNAALQQQQQLAQTRYQAQQQQQQMQQAGAMSTDVALQQAKTQLENLKSQQQQLLNQADQAQKKVQELQAERSELLSQS
jgi:chromosome segregation ATPase